MTEADRPAKRSKSSNGFLGRDFLSVGDFSREEFDHVIRVAEGFEQAMQKDDINAYRLASDKDFIMASLFYENSTRTSTSFAVACMRLGIKVVGFTGTAGTSVMKGESLRHTLDMFDAYKVCGVILRHPCDGAARFAADHLEIPVFNGGDGKHEHPTQTILDLFTIKQHMQRLDGIQIAMVGDLKYGRTVHSLALALAKYNNIKLHFLSHPDLAFPTDIITTLLEKGVAVKVWNSMEEMLPIVDILYQTRIQKERMTDVSTYQEASSMCSFTEPMLKLVRSDFRLMHPLPMDKTAPMVFSGMDAHPVAIYKQQAANGVPTRMAEIALSLGLLNNGEEKDNSAYQEPTKQLVEAKDLKCANKGCITAAEFQEDVPQRFERESNHTVKCHYCECVVSKLER